MKTIDSLVAERNEAEAERDAERARADRLARRLAAVEVAVQEHAWETNECLDVVEVLTVLRAARGEGSGETCG